MKKYILVILIVAILLVSGLCIWFLGAKRSSVNASANVDETINTMLCDEAYSTATVPQRAEMVRELLLELRREGKILNFSYHKEEKFFSFIYADGSLGGIVLEEPCYSVGSIPIN